MLFEDLFLLVPIFWIAAIFSVRMETAHFDVKCVAHKWCKCVIYNSLGNFLPKKLDKDIINI